MLNFYHLKYFCDACRFGSVSLSAKRNHISHSAVSQAIRSLESVIGQPLLVHAKRKFELTREGEALFSRGDELLSNVESLPREILESEKVGGHLRIGLSQSLWTGLLSGAIAQFIEKHPQLKVSIWVGNSSSLANLLEQKEIDIGFGIEDGGFVRFERTGLVKGKFVLAQRRGSSHSSRFIVGDKGAEVAQLSKTLAKKSARPEMMTVQSWSMIASLTAQGLGIGLIPDFLLRAEKRLIAVQKEIKLPSFEVSAFTRGSNSPVSARELISFLIQTGVLSF